MRKHIHFVLFFGASLLAACGHYLSESERIATAFEKAQLIYGEGENDTVLFIPELDKAPTYYARKKDFGKAALAALYLGYAEKDHDRSTATTAFKDAEQYGELVKDSLTVARAQYQMGRMLFYDGMGKEALCLLEKANNNFEKNYAEKALVLNIKACCHILLQEYEDADSCLRQGLTFAELENDDGAKAKILNNYAKLYQIQGNYDKAIVYLKMVKPKTSQQIVLNQLNLGNVYMAIGVMDSATNYFSSMEKNLSETNIYDETRASAYYSLSLFAENRGMYTQALAYQRKELQYQIKAKDRREKEGVYRIQQQYDYETIRNEMNEKIIVRQRVILLMGLLMVLVSLLLVVLKNRLAKMQKREMEAKERTLFYVRQYTDLLSRQGKTMQKLAIVMENKEDKALLDSLRATVFGKKDPWEALMEVFDTLHPNERERIRSQYPDLTEMETKDLILSYFNVSRQDESLMLKTGIHSIDKIRLSVRKKTQEKTEKPS